MATLELFALQQKRLQQNSLGAVTITEVAGRGRCCVAQWCGRVFLAHAHCYIYMAMPLLRSLCSRVALTTKYRPPGVCSDIPKGSLVLSSNCKPNYLLIYLASEPVLASFFGDQVSLQLCTSDWWG